MSDGAPRGASIVDLRTRSRRRRSMQACLKTAQATIQGPLRKPARALGGKAAVAAPVAGVAAEPAEPSRTAKEAEAKFSDFSRRGLSEWRRSRRR